MYQTLEFLSNGSGNVGKELHRCMWHWNTATPNLNVVILCGIEAIGYLLQMASKAMWRTNWNIMTQITLDPLVTKQTFLERDGTCVLECLRE